MKEKPTVIIQWKKSEQSFWQTDKKNQLKVSCRQLHKAACPEQQIIIKNITQVV